MTASNAPVKKPRRVKPEIIYSDSYSDHLAPRYWTTWLGLACMVTIAHLPYRAILFSGKLLGYLLNIFALKRRRITAINIGLCFPQLDETEQKKLVKRTIIDNGIGLLEMCIAWFNPGLIRPDMIEMDGEQILYDAVAERRGVILVGAHYTTLDLAGLLMAKYHKIGAMYRANKNPLFDLAMRNSRAKCCEQMIERSDMRAVIRFIRKGGLMWYAPDQDYGRKQAVFAPFFGVEAACITIIPRLVKMNDSPVLILGHHRKSDGSGYTVSISKPPENFPVGDERVDATVINRALETEILKYPEQYMWIHRRFKTRPEGEEKLYPRRR